MPTISLRLTDEEHAALKEWAYGSRRSMQREAIFRIFAHDLPGHMKEAITKMENEVIEEVRAATGRDDIVAEYDLTPINVKPRRQDEDPHFKPDPK